MPRIGALFFVFLVAAAPSARGQVRGRVVDIGTGAGIAEASIRVVAAETQREILTDADGSYALTGLPPAEYAMVVRHPGYDAARVRLHLRPDRELVVNVELALKPILLFPLLVPVRRDEVRARPPATVADSLAGPFDERRSGTFRASATSALGDLATAEVHGRPPDPSGRQPHALHIWGSSGDRGRVLLDGASINAPLHLGGVLPPLDPHLLSHAALRTGGASARYDGGTGYILDFRTRSPAGGRVRTWGELGLLATRIGLDAPFHPRGSLMVGARKVNRGVVDALIDGPFEYDYGDVVARGDWRTGAGGSTSALVLATRETVRLPRDLGYAEAAWRNFASAVSWSPDVPGEGPRLNGSFSRGVVDLPLLSAPDGQLEATLDRSSLTAENDWWLDGVGVDAGLQIEHVRLTRHSEASSDPALPDAGNGVRCSLSLPCASAAATTLAAFGDAAWQAGSAFAFRAGLRAALETGAPRVRLLPRLSATWTGGGRSAATLSLGRYSQTAVVETPDGATAPDPLRLRVTTEHATQLELRLTRSTPGLDLAASAFLRRDEGGAKRFGSLTTPGAELSWAVQSNGRSLSGGYSILARRAARPDSAPPIRHLAYLGASTGGDPLQLDVSATFGAGVSLTSIVLDGVSQQEGSGPDPAGAMDVGPYLRVDAALSGTWAVRLRGREARLTPYVRIINAFSRYGALFYYQDAGRAELRPLAALPTMPVAGVRWLF